MLELIKKMFSTSNDTTSEVEYTTDDVLNNIEYNVQKEYDALSSVLFAIS